MISWLLDAQTLFDTPDRLTDVGSWHTHAPFAFWCVEALRPRILVELGTHRGDSYAAFCQAVERLQLPTRCYAVDTWRGDAQAGEYGEEVFEDLRAYHDPRYGQFSRLVRSTFDEASSHFADGSIDLLHVDGLHTYEAARHDLETWAPKLSPAAVVLFHDVNVREGTFGVWRLWEELTGQRPSFTFHHGHGLGVLLWGSEAPEPARRLAASKPDEAVEIRRLFAHVGEGVAIRARLAESDADRRRTHQRARELTEALAREHTARSAAETRLMAGLQELSRAQQLASASVSRSLAETHQRLEELRAEVNALPGRALARRLGKVLHAGHVLLLVLYWTITFQLGSGLRLRKQARLIRRANLFDPEHYLSQLADTSVRDPVWHYLRRGSTAGLDPNAYFETAWYLQHNPDVAAAGMNPLVHYILSGANEGRPTSPRFDTAYYLAENPEVKDSGLNPLSHYLRYGGARGLRSARLDPVGHGR